MKDKNSLHDQIVSEELKRQLKLIYNDGLNVYALIERARKECHNKSIHFPDSVLLDVCRSYWFDKPNVRRPFPWFLKVLYMKWCDHNARMNIKASKDAKQAEDNALRGGCEMIGDVVKRLMTDKELRLKGA